MFHLAQPWAAQPEARFRPGTVRLAWSGDALLVLADLQDDEVRTAATEDNQRLWELGDVFEIFLQTEGSGAYAELHVAPNGVRMHLRFPESLPVIPVGFPASANLTAGGWQVEARIPADVCGLPCFEAGRKLRVSFCRYDAGTDSPPVLSTSAAHPEVSFHHPEEWPRIVLVKHPSPVGF